MRYYGTRSDNHGIERNFASVRFGNVIGFERLGRPLFKEQIAAGRPVDADARGHDPLLHVGAGGGGVDPPGDRTGRDPEMCCCSRWASPSGSRSWPKRMIRLAERSVRDADNPGGDIEIVTIGAREGGKLHEELFYDPAGVTPTSHPKILRGGRANGLPVDVPARIAGIRSRIEARDEPAVRQMLFDFGPP